MSEDYSVDVRKIHLGLGFILFWSGWRVALNRIRHGAWRHNFRWYPGRPGFITFAIRLGPIDLLRSGVR